MKLHGSMLTRTTAGSVRSITRRMVRAESSTLVWCPSSTTRIPASRAAATISSRLRTKRSWVSGR